MFHLKMKKIKKTFLENYQFVKDFRTRFSFLFGLVKPETFISSIRERNKKYIWFMFSFVWTIGGFNHKSSTVCGYMINN